MRLLGRLEVLSGWSKLVSRVTGIDNVMVNGVSGWNREEIGVQLSEMIEDSS